MQPLENRPRPESRDHRGGRHAPKRSRAMISLGRHCDKPSRRRGVETNGEWLRSWPWMLAMGARCRSMWLAGCGDVEAAVGTGGAGGGSPRAASHAVRTCPYAAVARPAAASAQRKKELRARDVARGVAGLEALGRPSRRDRTRADLSRTKVASSNGSGLNRLRTAGGQARRRPA